MPRSLRDRTTALVGSTASGPDANTAGVQPAAKTRRSRELFVFLLLAVLIWPFIAVGVVAGWGFLVWMYYLFTGPPGPV